MFRLIAAEPVDPGKNLGDHAVALSRNVFVQIHFGENLDQRGIFMYRNLIVLCQLKDLPSNVALSLGHEARRSIFPFSYRGGSFGSLVFRHSGSHSQTEQRAFRRQRLLDAL